MDALRDLVAEELAIPVDPRVSEFAAAIAGRHEGARAVLFYGSCLRQAELDGLMLDFYLIVADYRRAYPRRWMAAANALIPPNVFHAEHGGLVAKYAVLSEADFDRLAGPRTRNVSVWARFAQPSRLVWAADEAARDAMIDAISWSAPTLLAAAGPRAKEPLLDLWRRAFALTYSAELRAERRGRAGSVVDMDPERYRRFGAPALEAARVLRGMVSTGWLARRAQGKLLSVARLAKASLTFAGGADYIVWKINRHAGTDFALKPWQRRHPLLGAISLLPKLLKSGAVR
jgi:hypothetical protein